jgi:NADH-quinone oxidoreductase subunit F
MSLVHRVLYPEPIVSLEEYLARGGGAGLEAALGMDPDALIAVVSASGLRGRGGAGFPTGTKWKTVRDYHAERAPSTVVANGAEGEPGTYKDRTILRTTPYAVIEGALIAAKAVGANEIVFGLKRSFGPEVARLRSAVEEVKTAGWADLVSLAVFEGPNEYLYGEETALLETIDGRYPFPRIAPPWRRGDREVVEGSGDAGSRSGLSAHVVMAEAEGEGSPPTLVDNVETLANIPRIIARGASWFRTEGTEKSPGTIVCTVIGDVQREGVGEVIMGTPLRDVIDAISGGPRPGRRIKGILPGVSTGVITGDQLDVPVTYEDLAAIGSGLGSGGFMVFDDTADFAAVAAGASRFLAIESCGQCTPCKQDGIALSGLLDKLCRSDVSDTEWRRVASLVSTVGDRARCSLGTQHQIVIDSIIRTFPKDFATHVSGAAPPVVPRLIAELVEFDGDEALLDERHLEKQPDWTYDAVDSGQAPADRYGEHRHQTPLED